MLSPHFCLLQNKHPSSIFPPVLNTKLQKSYISHLIQHGAKKRTNLFSSCSSWVVHAVEKDSEQSEFEVDSEKAKEALQQLDQQLKTLSKKQVSTPKIRASEVKLARDKRAEGNRPEAEISGSFLAYLTGGLLIFTVFYNVLFYAVIKPSIDGPESGPELSSSSQSDESRGSAVLQKLPLLLVLHN